MTIFRSCKRRKSEGSVKAWKLGSSKLSWEPAHRQKTLNFTSSAINIISRPTYIGTDKSRVDEAHREQTTERHGHMMETDGLGGEKRRNGIAKALC
jgi:hypothetical protein